SSVAAARASAQPYPMRQRVTSPEGSFAHSAISFLCRAASARHVESACSCAIESCSCWYVVAAARAAACVHLYCSTRHCAAPLASMVILLHSRTSAAFSAADLKQPRADAVTAAANQAFVQRIPVPSCASVRLCVSYRCCSRASHGQGGIRTHGTLAGTPVFETGRFNRSRTCPLTAGEQNTGTDAQTHRGEQERDSR